MVRGTVLPPHVLGQMWHGKDSLSSRAGVGKGVAIGEEPPLVVRGTFLEFDFVGSHRRPRFNSDAGRHTGNEHQMHSDDAKKVDRWADSTDDEDDSSTVSGSGTRSPSLSCSSDAADSIDMDQTLELPSAPTWVQVPMLIPVVLQPAVGVADALVARKAALNDTVAQLAAAALQAETATKGAQQPRNSRLARNVGLPKRAPRAEVVVPKKTTLMLRNVPLQCTRSMLLDLLNAEGFKGKFDFVYLPINFDTRLAFGYCFINFVDEVTAESARSHFHGFNNWKVTCKEPCETSWSDPYQGLAANIERYRNSPVMHSSIPEEHKPVLFAGSKRKAFPAPTRFIKPPRGVRRSTPLDVTAKSSSSTMLS